MKEILYIQAGELSNYTGTHFWNTQESYLQVDESQESAIASNISFCETIDAQGRATLCPRLLLFDRKSNFGTLGKANSLRAIAAENDELASSLWSGHSVEYRQNLINRSSYHAQLEEERDDSDERPGTESKGIGDIRYWSDFNRLYYLPKSLQPLPDVPDWETTSLDWNQGQELFTRFNEETELMEGDLRLLVEECDHMQGIQVINDTDTFGGFMGSFLASFRDEYQKLPSFTFPLLSGAVSTNLGWDEPKRAKRIVNEALYLRTLNELASMNIPVEHPALWPGTVWASPLKFSSDSTYHQAALLSAHIETCTLPFRLQRNHQDIANISAQLKWRGPSPFAELHGIFPFTMSSDFNNRLANFSSDFPIKLANQYSRLDVTRGFSSRQIEDYSKWSSQYRGSNFSYSANIHALPYPLADTFPLLKELGNENSQGTPEPVTSRSSALQAVQSYSSLSSSANTAKVIEKYASFIEDCVRRRGSVITSIDIPLDDLMELVNDLWTIHDNSSAETDEHSLL